MVKTMFSSSTTLKAQLSILEVERKSTSHMITSAFPSGDFSAALKHCLSELDLFRSRKYHSYPTQIFSFQFSHFFLFKSHFCELRALHCNAVMVCYSVDRRADTIYLQTDAIAIRWEKSKETITMFYRKHRQVLRRKIPNIFLQGKPK